MEHRQLQFYTAPFPCSRRSFLFISGLSLLSAVSWSCHSSKYKISEFGEPPVIDTFEFEALTVNPKGDILERRPGRANFFREDLGNEVFLDMVKISTGKFFMGASIDERAKMNGLSSEPKHLVSVPSFYLGKYEITQAQWRTVARYGKVKHDLNPDLPHYGRDYVRASEPAEGVSWVEAVEFCERLSRKTKRLYRLPSEAEWEYTCRAGTTTYYHFGEELTPENAALVAQYNQELQDVGSFPPNDFGIYDMHGNVLEWCADKWHTNYEQAPADGSMWETPLDFSEFKHYRVIRGWKSARRSAGEANARVQSPIGFRVACFIP